MKAEQAFRLEQQHHQQNDVHYYAARETDAGLLRVQAAGQSSADGEVEKFLFYRGVASFHAPLTVTQSADGASVTLQNTGAEELRHLFLYSVHDGHGKFLLVNRLAPGATQSTSLNQDKNSLPLSSLRARIAREMQRGLAEEGLYEREAAAMVQTWDDSWFAEPGVRVLYTLARPWTDRTLPLTLDPPAREVVRVMVGRAELITPTMESELKRQIVRFGESDAQTRGLVLEDVRQLGLGRFLEPATRRLIATTPTREFSQLTAELLQALAKPAAEPKPFALR